MCSHSIAQYGRPLLLCRRYFCLHSIPIQEAGASNDDYFVGVADFAQCSDVTCFAYLTHTVCFMSATYKLQVSVANPNRNHLSATHFCLKQAARVAVNHRCTLRPWLTSLTAVLPAFFMLEFSWLDSRNMHRTNHVYFDMSYNWVRLRSTRIGNSLRRRLSSRLGI